MQGLADVAPRLKVLVDQQMSTTGAIILPWCKDHDLTLDTV
jgi:hypothetical protein